MTPIPQHLIESALALTGKTMEDMEYIHEIEFEGAYDYRFSIEKFFYFLLSPEFIEKYTGDVNEYMSDIPHAIYCYQSGNAEPIIQLLNHI